MHVIAKSALRVFWRNHPPAEHPLIEWYNVMRRARFADLNDLHAVFPSADYVPPFVVFNIGGNKYRLITEIFFGRQKLFIRYVLTHAEYDRGKLEGTQMTIADTAAALDADKVLAAWRPLHELVGLSAIRGEVEYQRMLRLTNLLLDQIGGDETHPLMGLLDLVSDLVEKYEDEHRPIPKASPIEVLRFLMEQGGLRQEDLKDCAPQGYISEVLAGKRSISKQVAKKLAASFNVSPELFI